MKLKVGLLSLILDNINTPNKYTKAYLNLKNVFELESKETDFKFTKEQIEKFNELEKSYNSFINGIPLKVVERYYIQHYEDLQKHCYLEFEDNELSDLKIIDLFYKLENYYEEIFEFACNIANYYNLEIKFTSQTSNTDFI